MKHLKCWGGWNKKQPTLSTRDSILANQSFKNEGKINIFPDKQMLRELMSTRPALQEMLKGVLKVETK